MGMNSEYDIAVLGAGFGGSLFAACAAAIGYSVILVEKHHHPRFAIGESTSPLANLVLEEIAQAYDLKELLPLTNYASWKSTVPHLRCGLKRGFTYYTHPLGKPRSNERDNELLVAASPCDAVADMHWMREDVDLFFCNVARSRGVDYRDDTRTEIHDYERGWCLTLHTAATADKVTAKFLIDAGGPRGTVANFLKMGEASFPTLPETSAIYTHFNGVELCNSGSLHGAPYPPDWAAVHHLFDGGWIWSLRFDDGLVSAGAALTKPFMRKYLRADHPDLQWQQLLELLPGVRSLFCKSAPARPFCHAPTLSWRASKAAGRAWAMLPSAAASIDPLFSTGIPLTLLGIQRLMDQLGSSGLDADLTDYSRVTLDEADCTAALVGACYKTMGNMALFAPLTMLYFAGVSYAETARRTGRTRLSSGFMSLDRAAFRRNMLAILGNIDRYSATPSDVSRLWSDIAEIIAQINVAGLAQHAKHNWYGVDLQDIVISAAKLGYSSPSIKQLLTHEAWANGCGDNIVQEHAE